MKNIPAHYFNNIGNTYFDITIIDLKLQNGNVKAIYRCKCGTINQCAYSTLSKKCKECYKGKGKKKSKHGLSFTPEHTTWTAMKKRCRNPNDPAYHNYGGRGIKVCERWTEENGFSNFLQDMGERPEPKFKYSLDRIDNNKDYTPDNCRWATKKEQLFNKRGNIATHNKECTVCQQPYVGFLKNLYCSRSCQMIAYRSRKLKPKTTSPS